MKQTARETIDQLLEVLTAAVAETQREPDGWKADACAGRWMRNELTPIIETLIERAAENGMPCTCLPTRRTLADGPHNITKPGKIDEDCPQHGTLSLIDRLPGSCPQCGEGEEITYPALTGHPNRRRPFGASYDCGHWITFPPDERQPRRSVLPMASNVRVTGSAQISVRPLREAFQPERIVISNPNDWLVDDILIGGQTQLPAVGGPDYTAIPDPLPGDLFTPNPQEAGGVRITLGVIQADQDLTMVVTYVGNDPEGAEFRAAVFGSAAVQAGELTEEQMASIAAAAVLGEPSEP